MNLLSLGLVEKLKFDGRRVRPDVYPESFSEEPPSFAWQLSSMISKPRVSPSLQIQDYCEHLSRVPFQHWQLPLGLLSSVDKLVYLVMQRNSHCTNLGEILYFQQMILKQQSFPAHVLNLRMGTEIEDSLKFRRDLLALVTPPRYDYARFKDLLQGPSHRSAKKPKIIVAINHATTQGTLITQVSLDLFRDYEILEIIYADCDWPVCFTDQHLRISVVYPEDPVFLVSMVPLGRADLISRYKYISDYPLLFTSVLLRDQETIDRYLDFEDRLPDLQSSWRTRRLQLLGIPDEHYFLLLDLIFNDLRNHARVRTPRPEEILDLMNIAIVKRKDLLGILLGMLRRDPVYGNLLRYNRPKLLSLRTERLHSLQYNEILVLLNQILMNYTGEDLRLLLDDFSEFLPDLHDLGFVLHQGRLEDALLVSELSGNHEHNFSLLCEIVNRGRNDLLRKFLRSFPDCLWGFLNHMTGSIDFSSHWQKILEHQCHPENFLSFVMSTSNLLDESLINLVSGITPESLGILLEHLPHFLAFRVDRWDATILHFLMLLQIPIDEINPADFLIRNSQGISPFHIAVSQGNLKVMYQLLPHLKVSDLVYKHGDILKIGITGDLLDCVQFVLENFNFEDHGQIFEWARFSSSSCILDLLLPRMRFPANIEPYGIGQIYLAASHYCPRHRGKHLHQSWLHWPEITVGACLLLSDDYLRHHASHYLGRFFRIIQALPLLEHKLPIFLQVSPLFS